MGFVESSLLKYAVPVLSRLPESSLTSDLLSHTHCLPSALEKDLRRKAVARSPIFLLKWKFLGQRAKKKKKNPQNQKRLIEMQLLE